MANHNLFTTKKPLDRIEGLKKAFNKAYLVIEALSA